MKSFSNLIWSLPIDSNPLPDEIGITAEQYKILKEMSRPIFKSFGQYCQKFADEKKIKVTLVMMDMDLLTTCWPQIVAAYDEISKMIMSEEQQRADQEEQEFPLLVWNLKRMLIGLHFLKMLMSDPNHCRRGAEAFQIVRPVVDDAI